MRWILDVRGTSELLVIGLALAAGISRRVLFQIFATDNPIELGSLESFLRMGIVLIVPGVILGCYWLIAVAGAASIIGRWLGGRGTYRELRRALAWGNAPGILLVAVWFPTMMARLHGLGFSPMAKTALAMGAGLSGWVLVITVKCIAEAHRFSSRRALLTLLPTFAVCCGGPMTFFLVLYQIVKRTTSPG